MVLVFWCSLIQNGSAMMWDRIQKHSEHPVPELQYYMMEQLTRSCSISLISSWDKYPLRKDVSPPPSKPKFPNLSGFVNQPAGEGMVLYKQQKSAWMCIDPFAQVAGKHICSHKWNVCAHISHGSHASSCVPAHHFHSPVLKGSGPNSGPRHGDWGILF